MSRVAFASHDGSMLAVWLDSRPTGKPGQAPADGWSLAPRTEHLAMRLAELAGAERPHVVWIDEIAARIWHAEDNARKRAAKAAKKAAAPVQSAIPIPQEIEEEGRRAARAPWRLR
jgi:hypothetical protein